MQYLHTNNASSNLRTAIAPGALNVVVTSGQGSLFPNPGVDQGFFVTVEDRRSGRLEIMLCTIRVGDSLTVTRGQQGTIPQSFGVGVNVSNRITAQILNEFVSATVDVVPVDRIPPITSAMIVSLDAAKLVGPGKVPVAVFPPITSAMITSLDAAKLTGTVASARITSVSQAALPEIPSANLTSVPAESLTGTINVARIAAESLASSKISSLDAAKLTGTINEARFPTGFSITGNISAQNIATSGHVIAGTYMQADGSITSLVGDVKGKLIHANHGGYFLLGAFDSSYGSGYAQIWFDRNDNEVNVYGAVGPGYVKALGFRGDGDEITGVLKAVSGAVEAPRWLLGPGGGHTSGFAYAGTDLATPHFVCDTANNDMSMTFGAGPGGNWRAMQTGLAAAGRRVLGLFVRTS